ncbi:MAG TPA: DMT family transporter, partial [Deinococcales bacterium]|nr:DMT family transporter [Deinococcales bacterium]
MARGRHAVRRGAHDRRLAHGRLAAVPGRPDQLSRGGGNGGPLLPSPVLLGIIVLAVGVSAIFIRLAEAPGTIIAVYRLLLASLLSLPAALRGLSRSRVTARGLALTLAAGVLLGWHFATWITSLEHTGVAASMVFVNSSPLWIVLLAWLFLKERPRKGVGAGILTAVAGGLILGLDGTSAAAGAAGDRPLFGNMLALSGAVFVSGNMLLGRAAQRSGLSLMAYSGLSYLAA